MGFCTTLIIILLGFIAVISRRIYATISDLETKIGSLQTQLAILQKAQKDAEVEKEHSRNDLEKLRAQLEKWRERDQEEKLTLIGSISIVSERIENDRQRALEAQSICADEAAERRAEKEIAHKKSKGVKKHMSMGGLNMEEERERRRRELEGKVHPALKRRSSKLDSGYEQMDRVDGVDSDVGEVGYMGGSDGNAVSGESGGSDESRSESRCLLTGRSLKRRPAMLFD